LAILGEWEALYLDSYDKILYSISVQIGREMTIHTTYTQARAELARLMDRVSHDRDVVVITRRGAEDVALISAAELSSLTETAYLLRSPKNAERLLAALGRALKNEGRPLTLEELRQEVGFESEEA